MNDDFDINLTLNEMEIIHNALALWLNEHSAREYSDRPNEVEALRVRLVSLVGRDLTEMGS